MERYYTIRDADENNFRTGLIAEGGQVLMGLLCPELVVLKFDAEGHFVESEARPWDSPADRMEGGGPYRITDRAFRAALDRQFGAWQREIGFEPGTISVRRFFLEDRYLGIKDSPDHFEDPSIEPELIEDWEEAGRIALWWGKDYWMDADGEIEST